MYMLLLTVLLAGVLVADKINDGGLKFIFSVLIFYWLVFLSIAFDERLVYKYRIVRTKLGVAEGKTWYRPEALKAGILFIPYWQSVSLNYSQGTTHDGYYTPVVFKSANKALKAIELHKEVTKENRKTLFTRPKREKKNIIKVK